jgi:DNA-binding NarL/FixJ family response regulator
MMGHNSVTIYEFFSMLETLIKVSLGTKKIPIAVIIEKTTPLSLIKELQKTNVIGIIPSSTTFDLADTFKALEALTNRIPYWPKHILEQLPGNIKKTKIDNVDLTTRQIDVLKLIKERGASNKVIAKLLNISESTVKLHVGAILKKYNLKNRTQLALFTEK